jgi:hypothetical protein
MRIIAVIVWGLLLIVATTCPLMAGCAGADNAMADACCQQSSCPREPQHNDDCPYKIRDSRQAEAKFSLTLDASMSGPIDAAAKVFVSPRHAALAEPAAPFAESGRFLKLRVLLI